MDIFGPISYVRSGDPEIRILNISLKSAAPKTAGRDGGKEAAHKLYRPVKRNSKRAKIIDWLLAYPDGRSILDGIKQLHISRSNLFATLAAIHLNHGIGYSFINGIITIKLPRGCGDIYGA